MDNTGTPDDSVVTSYAKAPTSTISVEGVTYAYRELGPKGGIPVVFFVHLAGTLDNWDPRIIDFFNRNTTGKPAAKAFIKRLQERTVNRDQPNNTRAFQTQLKAIQAFGRSTPSDLSTLRHSTLIANGDNDRMVPSVLPEDLHQRIKGSELIIHPDSGHGAIFQHHAKFAPAAIEFLAN